MALPDNLGNIKNDLQDINQLASILETSFIDISKATADFAKNQEDSKNAIGTSSSIVKDLAKSAKELAGFGEENLKNQKDVANLDRKRQSLISVQRRLEAKILELQGKRVNASKKEQKAIDKTIDALVVAKDQSQELVKNFDSILDTSKKIEKTNPFASVGDLISSIPVLNKVFPEFAKASETFKDNIIEGKGAMRALGKSTLQTVGAFSKLATLEIIRRGVDEVDLLQKRVVSFQRELGISSDQSAQLQVSMSAIANASGEAFFNSARFTEAQQSLNGTLGTNVTISEEMAENFALLKYRLGLSTEEATKFNNVALGLGKNAREFTGEVNARVMLLNGENKLQIDRREILKDISQTSARTQLSLKAQGKSITDAVYSARKLGLNLSDVEKISDSLLNFEQSISNELEAELLTGKDLNLERARAAALNNDYATVAAEISKQVGSAAEFGDMNRIQQEAIAQAVGMTADELASSLLFQENISKLTADSQYKDSKSLEDLKEKVRLRAKEVDENGKQVGFAKALSEIGNEELKNQIDAATVQEQLAEAQKKAADTMIETLGPKGLLGTMNTLNASIDKLITAVYILAGVQALGSIVNVVKSVKNLSGYFKNSSSAAKQLTKETSNISKNVNNVLRRGGAGSKSGQFLAKESAQRYAKIHGTRAAEKRFGKSAIKGLGKTGAKFAPKLLKAIPGVGLIAGLAFAGEKLMKGDFAGAGLEALSGVVSTIPGFGTAASLALDAGIMARDISMNNKASTPQTMEVGDFTIKPLDKDTITMAGGTKLGGNVESLLKELITVVSNNQNVYLDSTKINTANSLVAFKSS